jgi:hypothetical protein
MGENTLDKFIEVRDYLQENLESMITTYLCGLWDPLIEFVILKELNIMIDRDIRNLFPELPQELVPRYSYRVFKIDEEKEDNTVDAEVEISIQQYLNQNKGLMFLGNYCEHDGVSYDLYCSPYYDGLNNFLFYARYGHIKENCFTGAAEARAEYNLGVMSPLSVAYGMAVYDGYINE